MWTAEQSAGKVAEMPLERRFGLDLRWALDRTEVQHNRSSFKGVSEEGRALGMHAGVQSTGQENDFIGSGRLDV